MCGCLGLHLCTNSEKSDTIVSSHRYYAHSGTSNKQGSWHLLEDHLKETGLRAAEMLERTGSHELARVAGLLHDLGKYSSAFQTRLTDNGPRVNHSTAGAKEAINRYGPKIGKMLAYAIAGHHAGLANGVNGSRISSLADRLAEKGLPKLDKDWKREIELPQSIHPPSVKIRSRETIGFSASFLIRMVFSALVDADFLDTERYYATLENRRVLRGDYPSLEDLSKRLERYLSTLAKGSQASDVNEIRCHTMLHARQQASKRLGIFTLTVPTGGGKTLISLAFALDHALRHGLSRIIYVIPYTSIIEQTASVFRKALGDHGSGNLGFVLEHHSTFDENQISNREGREKLQLATQNWDAPVVVTTAVQFFESLFGNRPSHCRKLHNICNSIVILDEAQTLPLKFLRACVSALDELVRNWRSSIVLCTATQPALCAPSFKGGFQDAEEIAPNPSTLYRKLQRCQIIDKGFVDDSTLTSELRSSHQCLVIVNTRRHAQDLYGSIQDVDGAFHLTTLMCALHRRDKLTCVRKRLLEGESVRLIATSLIEAGVDIDFPVVWRAEAGLESIIQAAGRCNRERKKMLGHTYVFRPSEELGGPEIQQLAAVARSVMRQHEDPISLDAIRDYFQEVYWVKGDDLDAMQIEQRLNEPGKTLEFPFESVAEDFRLIDTPSVPLIVPYKGIDGMDDTVDRLIEELRWIEGAGRIAKQLQPYVVSVWPHVLYNLIESGAASIIEEPKFADQFVLLTNTGLYHGEMGLNWKNPEVLDSDNLIVT